MASSAVREFSPWSLGANRIQLLRMLRYLAAAMSRLIPTPKPNLMIVDDDPDQLGLFRLAAEWTCLYWRIATAEDGEVAFKQIKQWEDELPRFVPQIILTDIKMPRVGGVEFARKLRRDPSLPPIHLIAMSSSSYPPEVQAALDAGCEAFFQKPGDFGKLTDILRQLPSICGVSGVGPSLLPERSRWMVEA